VTDLQNSRQEVLTKGFGCDWGWRGAAALE